MSKIAAVVFCGLLGGVLTVVLVGVWMLPGGNSDGVVKHSATERRVMAAREKASQANARAIEEEEKAQKAIDFIFAVNKKISEEDSYAGMAGVARYPDDNDIFRIAIANDGMLAMEKTTTRIQFFSSLTDTFQQLAGESYVQLHLYYGPKHICTLIGTGPGDYKETGCDV